MNRLLAPARQLEYYPILEVERERVPYAVNLGDRALALTAITDYLNHAARLSGANKSNALQRYGREASRVKHGMETDVHQLKQGFDAGIAVLAAEDALRANGVDESDVEVAHTSVQAAINKDMGLMVPHGDAVREKVVKKAVRAAMHVRLRQ